MDANQCRVLISFKLFQSCKDKDFFCRYFYNQDFSKISFLNEDVSNLDVLNEVINEFDEECFIYLDGLFFETDYKSIALQFKGESLLLCQFEANDGNEGFQKTENYIFSRKIQKEKIKVLPCIGELYDLRDQNVEELIFPRQGALFLDCDGVIIKDKHYLHHFKDVEYHSEILELMEVCSKQKIPIFVLTNQSGIAREYFTEEEYKRYKNQILKDLETKNIQITGWHYCPYHADKGKGIFKKPSFLRKPDPGMLLEASRNQRIDFSKSFMIGDKKTDVLNWVGIRYYLVKGAYPVDSLKAEFIGTRLEVVQKIKSEIQ